MKKMGIIFIASAFMMVTCSLTAFAGDGKIYPGSMGVRYSGTAVPSYNCSAIGNPSTTTWLYVDLPVIHDSINHNIKKGWVKAIDMNFNHNITASLTSAYRGSNGFYGWFSGTKSTAGTSTAAQTLNFGGLGSNSTAHYFYSCKIPPKYNNHTSRIISYYVEENT